MRKPAFCVCKNKGADQLCCNHTVDQRICFHYIDSTIPLLPKSKISSLYPSSVNVQQGLYQTWSVTAKKGFLMTWLIWSTLNTYLRRLFILFVPLSTTLNTSPVFRFRCQLRDKLKQGKEKTNTVHVIFKME